MTTVTIDDILSWAPCDDYDRARVEELMGDRKRISALEILELDIPIDHRLWAVLRRPFFTEAELRLLACDFAEHVLPIFEAQYPGDKRPHQVIEVSRRFALGEATADDLACARAAAWTDVKAALQAAAEATAEADAWTTARIATQAAMGATAVKLAVRAVPRSTAWSTAAAARWAVAWAAGDAESPSEENWQLEHIRAALKRKEDESHES